ncbi:hypothetical protein Tco_0222000 [Tanacetum coccineum]
MENGIFFNQSKYIKEMLKKFRLEESKPTKMPMSAEIKLTKDDEADSVDCTKYRVPYLLLKSPVDHEPSVAIVVSANVVDRSIGTDNPRLLFRTLWFLDNHVTHLTFELPVDTPENPFIAPTTLKFIQPFLKIVGYQGNVDKVSDFFTKYLAQPWQTMFKVFNPCLTLRTSGHDQRLSSLRSIEERCDSYKEYEKVFVGVDVHMIQPQPVDTTQETNRTPTPTVVVDDVAKKKKRKQVAGESSSPRKSLKVTIKQKKPSTTLIPPPSDDRERDEIAKATLLTSEFADSVFLIEEEDFGTRLEPGSHKKNPKTVDDDDDDDEEEKKDVSLDVMIVKEVEVVRLEVIDRTYTT